MDVFDWFAKWQIPHAARMEFLQEVGMYPTETAATSLPAQGSKQDEAWVGACCRIEAAKHHDRLWRNNVGVLEDDRGVPVRYGLSNDSAKMNEVIKSADLIGIKRTVVTAQMVGKVHGLFWSVENKKPGWIYAGTGREPMQQTWMNHVISLGGVAEFCSDHTKLY